MVTRLGERIYNDSAKLWAARGCSDLVTFIIIQNDPSIYNQYGNHPLRGVLAG